MEWEESCIYSIWWGGICGGDGGVNNVMIDRNMELDGNEEEDNEEEDDLVVTENV